MTPLVCLKASKCGFCTEACKYGFSVVPEILFCGKMLPQKTHFLFFDDSDKGAIFCGEWLNASLWIQFLEQFHSYMQYSELNNQKKKTQNTLSLGCQIKKMGINCISMMSLGFWWNTLLLVENLRSLGIIKRLWHLLASGDGKGSKAFLVFRGSHEAWIYMHQPASNS